MAQEEPTNFDWLSSARTYKSFVSQLLSTKLREHLLSVCISAAAVGIVATFLVSGRTNPGKQSHLQNSLPRVASSTNEYVYVDVDGAVNRPGVYKLSNGLRVNDALALAGDVRPQADLSQINRAAVVRDGQKIFIPMLGAPVASAAAATSGEPSGPVNLNDASLDQLQNLPGVGPSTAQAIVTYREKQGPFKTIDDLDNVPGIGPSKLARLKPLVAV